MNIRRHLLFPGRIRLSCVFTDAETGSLRTDFLSEFVHISINACHQVLPASFEDDMLRRESGRRRNILNAKNRPILDIYSNVICILVKKGRVLLLKTTRVFSRVLLADSAFAWGIAPLAEKKCFVG